MGMFLKKLNVTARDVSTFLLLFLTMTRFLGFYVAPNEENYFLLSKLFLHPELLPHTFTAYDVPGTRILFQYISGFFLQFMSYESFALWSRTVNYLLYSLIFTKIFKKLDFNLLESLFVIAVLFLSRQDFFGDEWMIKSFESKTLAYVFVLWSIYHLLEKHYTRGVLFAALSIYFHILVGGWYAMVIFIYLLFKEGFFRTSKMGALYILVAAPFIAYLFTNYFMDNPITVNGINTNWIYTAIRVPHHTYPFKSADYFVSHFLRGSLMAFISFMLSLFYFRRLKDEELSFFNTLNIIIFTQQFLFLAIAYFDTNGFLLRYYPFRLSCLAALFTYIILVLYAKRHFLSVLPKHLAEIIRARSRFMAGVVLIVIAFFVVSSMGRHMRNIRKYNGEEARKAGLYSWVKNNTCKDDVFILRGYDDLGFIRNTDREVFSIFKFVPTRSRAIYEWYVRFMENERFNNDISHIKKIRDAYRVDYVVSTKAAGDARLDLVYKDKAYFLYKINDPSTTRPTRR